MGSECECRYWVGLRPVDSRSDRRTLAPSSTPGCCPCSRIRQYVGLRPRTRLAKTSRPIPSVANWLLITASPAGRRLIRAINKRGDESGGKGVTRADRIHHRHLKCRQRTRTPSRPHSAAPIPPCLITTLVKWASSSVICAIISAVPVMVLASSALAKIDSAPLTQARNGAGLTSRKSRPTPDRWRWQSSVPWPAPIAGT